ncbi:MAG: hypothetical protein HY007_03530 [Candidatus Sungbacteria bacterium]|nr:hypothetical protein [Candidatus Sungbacteria bacterium]
MKKIFYRAVCYAGGVLLLIALIIVIAHHPRVWLAGLIQRALAASGLTGSGTVNQVAAFNDSSTLGNSIIYDNGSNVGIGTTAPGRKLDVNGDFQATDIYTTDGVQIQGLSGRNYFRDEEGAGNLRVGATWGMPGVYAESGVGVLGGANGASLQNNALFVAAGGNVGIGTTAPGNKLDVNGQIVANNNIISHAIVYSINNGNNQSYLNSDDGGNFSQVVSFSSLTPGNYGEAFQQGWFDGTSYYGQVQVLSAAGATVKTAYMHANSSGSLIFADQFCLPASGGGCITSWPSGGSGGITTETDPTVSAWAKAASPPGMTVTGGYEADTQGGNGYAETPMGSHAVCFLTSKRENPGDLNDCVIAAPGSTFSFGKQGGSSVPITNDSGGWMLYSWTISGGSSEFTWCTARCIDNP